MRIASLFSGIGGFEKGILQAMPDAEIVFSWRISVPGFFNRWKAERL